MGWSAASGRHDLEARLRRMGGQPDERIDLAEAALLLAALDRPRVALDRYRHHVELLGRDLGKAAADLDAGESVERRAEALRRVMAEDNGYQGDNLTYDDLQNANLMRVIDRRKGLPVALGILYLSAARAQGWTAAGLNFPGHFLISLAGGGERAILDPFDRGRALDTAELRALLKVQAGEDAELRPEHYAEVENRGILLRLQNNIKLRLLHAERPQEALEIVETMLMLAPGEALLWRDAGMLHMHLGNLRAAVVALEHVLELSDDPAVRHEAARLMQQVRGKLN